MTSQDPVTSKSHTFQDHHGDVRSRLAAECRAGGPFPVSWHFSDCSPAFSCLTVSFVPSFFLFFWDWEVSVSFSCLTSLFVCARAGAFLFCSGWRLDFPAPFSLLSTFPSKNTQALRVLIAGWFTCHMYNLTKWKCDSDAAMSEYKLPTAASLLSRWLRCWRAASQQLIDRWRTRSWNQRSRMKTTRTPLPHCRFKKSRQASPSLWTDKAKSPYACRFASTSNDHSISEGETELQTFQGDTHIANRKDQATEH